MSRLSHSYHILGIRQGAGLEEIKIAHRRLVRQWHPDIYHDEDDRRIAHRKISEINAAYTYLSTLKRRNSRHRQTAHKSSSSAKKAKREAKKYHSYSSSQRTSYSYYSSHRSSRSSFASQKDTSSATSRKSSNKNVADLEFSWLNRFQQKMMSGIHERTLNKKRRDFSSENLKKLLKEQESWKKLKKKYEERTRIGMYRSITNALLFGKILGSKTQSDTPLTSLGSFSLSQKYETDLRHHLIQDNIFYATNKGLNIVLKFLFGALFISEFIFLLANYFLYGLFSSAVTFVAVEMGILSLFAIVFLPDNLFQRYLLWHYRNLSRSDIQRTFSNRSLPQPWKRRKYRLLWIKYITAFTLTGIYHYFVFLPLVFGD